MREWLPLLMAISLAGSTGCETFGPRQCDTSLAGNPPVTYNGGATEDGVYMSTPWDGRLLAFPGGQRYTLVHGLGRTPTSIAAYLSFDPYGTRDGGIVAEAAGNQVEIVGVDATSLQVANDSCTDYYVLVVAGVSPLPPAP